MTDSKKPEVALEPRQDDGEKLFSPSAGRNREAIADVLAEHLPQGARVLEIGSGTGEHAATLLERRPDVTWQPSDPDGRSRLSQKAWSQDVKGRMAKPWPLNLTFPHWNEGLGRFDALVCVNVIHIAPLKVMHELAARADQLVEPGGLVYLYGPYLEGDATAPSNLAFDVSLKERDPDWGVRPLGDVAKAFDTGGFPHMTRIDMPANNLSLVFKRDEASHASS